MEQTERPLTIATIAEEQNVSHETVKGWIQGGQLKAFKLGHKTVRILRKDLDIFLSDRYGAKYFMTDEERKKEETERVTS